MKPGEKYSTLFEHSLKLSNTYFQGMQAMLSHQRIINENLKELMLVSQKLGAWQGNMLRNSPQAIFQECYSLFNDYSQLRNHLSDTLAGKTTESFIEPAISDKRFKSPHWKDNIWFYACLQNYLLFTHHIVDFIEKHPGINIKENEQVLFFVKQLLNALSPGNYLLTNPEVVFKTIEQKGENLFKGWEQLLEDIQQGKGFLNPLMVDRSAYTVGKNIATTKGKVVFKNKLIELIQYSPETDDVHEIPLLIVPPWINKYYVLDLRENNSFVKWIVSKGYTVFIISWVNPDQRYHNTAFQDYMLEGTIPAIDAILRITRAKKINTLGFCIGGTLLTMTLAYLGAKGDQRINSATLLATLLDFERPGDLGLLIDKAQLTLLKLRIEQQGYLDGRLLMGVFNLLRANELFWPYVINNYLLGKDPYAFDLLFWNQDSTHLPANMACEYLEQLYLENRLVKDKVTWNDVRLSLTNVNVPCYFLATEQDHIAPWMACFAGAKRVKGDVTFVLGGSGHIAGIVNPPSANKYGYYTAKLGIHRAPSAATWLYEANKHHGSWWEHWQDWLSHLSGEMVDALHPAAQFAEAPGENVKKSIYKS